MSEAALTAGNAGELKLSGVLDFRSGPQLRETGAKMIREHGLSDLVLDCSGVEKSSSVGLSLLLAFMRDAHKAGKTLTIRALPEDMRQIAGVSGLDELLPLEV